MHVFILTVEESSQQRQRTPRPLDQGGFRARPDFRVFGHHTIFPVSHLGGVPGLIRTLGLARLRKWTRCLSECWYRQSTEQRADEQVSHGRGKTDERVKPLGGRLVISKLQ